MASELLSSATSAAREELIDAFHGGCDGDSRPPRVQPTDALVAGLTRLILKRADKKSPPTLWSARAEGEAPEAKAPGG